MTPIGSRHVACVNAVLRSCADFYAEAHLGPDDVLLIIEVADASVEYEREVKMPLYARAGIPEVWLALLAQGSIEVSRRPSPQGYQEIHTAQRGQRLSPRALLDLECVVDEILG